MDKQPITVAEFERIVTRLSNSCFVRHWIRWKDEASGPYSLALCCIDWDGSPLKPYEGDLAGWDFITEPVEQHTAYLFRRADLVAVCS